MKESVCVHLYIIVKLCLVCSRVGLPIAILRRKEVYVEDISLNVEVRVKRLLLQ